MVLRWVDYFARRGWPGVACFGLLCFMIAALVQAAFYWLQWFTDCAGWL